MKKLITALFVAMLLGFTAFAQSPIVSVKSIKRTGTPTAVDAGYFRIYNTGGTSAVSYVTIVSDSTNLFTVSAASDAIAADLPQITVTFATSLDAGNYSGNILVTQTNAPVTIRTIPVSLVIKKSYLVPWGTSGDPRRIEGTTIVPENYTPRYYGDMIVGTDGGTTTVWIATGLTTNDWAKPAP